MTKNVLRGFAIVVPIIIATIEAVQSGRPEDVFYGVAGAVILILIIA